VTNQVLHGGHLTPGTLQQRSRLALVTSSLHTQLQLQQEQGCDGQLPDAQLPDAALAAAAPAVDSGAAAAPAADSGAPALHDIHDADAAQQLQAQAAAAAPPAHIPTQQRPAGAASASPAPAAAAAAAAPSSAAAAAAAPPIPEAAAGPAHLSAGAASQAGPGEQLGAEPGAAADALQLFVHNFRCPFQPGMLVTLLQDQQHVLGRGGFAEVALGRVRGFIAAGAQQGGVQVSSSTRRPNKLFAQPQQGETLAVKRMLAHSEQRLEVQQMYLHASRYRGEMEQLARLEADVARQAAGPGVVVVCGFGGLARGRDASELLPAIQAAAAAGSGEASSEAVRACWQQVTQRQLDPAIMMHHYPLGDLEGYLWTLPGRRMQPLQAQAFIHLLAEALCRVHKTEHAHW